MGQGEYYRACMGQLSEAAPLLWAGLQKVWLKAAPGISYPIAAELAWGLPLLT